MAAKSEDGHGKYSIIHLPQEIISKSPGFSLDIGASTAKLIYRPKSLYEGGKLKHSKEGQPHGPLNMITYPRDDIDDITKEISENCDISQDELPLTVNVTGCGCSFYQDKIESALKVRLVVQSEFKVFAKALSQLSQVLSDDELYLDKPQRGIEAALNLEKQLHEWEKVEREFSGFGYPPGWRDDDPPDIEITGRWQHEPRLPALVVQCGSSWTFMKLYEGGMAELTDVTGLGGRTFLGLSCILGGSQDFDHLYHLMETHDGRSVDIYSDDLVDSPPKRDDCNHRSTQSHPTTDPTDSIPQHQEKNSYNSIPSDVLVFPFGKATSSPANTLKVGDMLHSLLNVMCNHLANYTQMACVQSNTKRAYICGSFPSLPLAAEGITREFTIRNLMVPRENRIDFQFIRNGGYMGAIGSFLIGCERI